MSRPVIIAVLAGAALAVAVAALVVAVA